MAKEHQSVSEPRIPADREGQLALMARLTDGSTGGLLTAEDLNARLRELQAETSEKVIAVTAAPEVATENLALARFKEHYDRWNANDRAKVSWETVQERLLADGGEKLNLANALHEGGVMFGVDANGKILFADGGEDVTDIQETTGLDYPNTRKAVMFRRDDKGKEIRTGYEMFPEDLIRNFETLTGHPFVASKDRKEYREAWLESGENPDWPRHAYLLPGAQAVYVYRDLPRSGGPLRGVRRLLRV